MKIRSVLFTSLVVFWLVALALPVVAQAPDTPGPVVVGVWELTPIYAHTVTQLKSGYYPNETTYTANQGYIFLELMIRIQRADSPQTVTLKDSEFEMSVVDASGAEFPLEGTGTGFTSYCMKPGCTSEYYLSEENPVANVIYLFTVSSDMTDPNYTLKIAPDVAVPFTVPFVANFDARFTAEVATPVSRADLKPITRENVASLAPLSTHTVFGYYMNDLTFSADGSRVVSTGCDLYGKSGCLSSAVRTWYLDSGELAGTVTLGDTTSGGVYSTTLSEDGSLLAGLDWEVIHFWDMATGDPLPLTIPAESVNNLIMAPDGTRLAVCGGEEKSFTLWDTSTGEAGVTLPGPCGGGAFSPDGQWLAVFGGMPNWGNGDGLIHVWDTLSGQAGPVIGQTDAEVVQSKFVFSPDGALLASGYPSTYDGDGIIHLWDTATGAEIAAWHQSETSKAVLSLAFSPDGSLLVSAEENGTLHVWDVSTQQEIAVVGEPGGRNASQLVFNADGTLLAQGRGAGTIEVWGVP